MNIASKTIIILASFTSILSLTSCDNATSEPQDSLTLTIMTHDSFAVSEEVISSFQEQHNVKVNILNSGDASTTVNLAILNKSEPLADVIYGIDNTLLTRALDNDILEKYESPNAYDLEKEFLLDTQQRVTPINYGDVCLNYDKSYFNANEIEIPDSLQSLTNPDYANLLVVQNPAASSPCLLYTSPSPRD